MFFPILLIGVSAGIMIACAYWAKVDEDDTFRKVVTSVVQIMCLMTMIAGVVFITERLAKGAPPVEAEASTATPSGPATPRVSPATSADLARQVAARAQAAEAVRQWQQAREADRRLDAENQERLRNMQAQAGQEAQPGPAGGTEPTTSASVPLGTTESGPTGVPSDNGTPPPTDPPPAASGEKQDSPRSPAGWRGIGVNPAFIARDPCSNDIKATEG